MDSHRRALAHGRTVLDGVEASVESDDVRLHQAIGRADTSFYVVSVLLRP
jgi:hypothetical protein